LLASKVVVEVLSSLLSALVAMTLAVLLLAEA